MGIYHQKLVEWTLELKKSRKMKRNFDESHQQKCMKGNSLNSLISTSSWVTSVTSYFVSPPFPTLPKALPWTIFETTVATKGISPLFNSISPFFFSRIREIRLVTWWSTNMLRGRYLVVILSYEIWRVTDGHGVTCQNITKWQHPTIYQVYISGRASPPALFKTRGAKRFWTNLAGVHGSLGFFIPKFSETNSARKYIKH